MTLSLFISMALATVAAPTNETSDLDHKKVKG